MKCNICDNNTNILDQIEVLKKYKVNYYKCTQCNFIQTETPYWLNEAYSNAITSLDIGLIGRNNMLSNIVAALIKSQFDPNAKFLDYGGGYGIFVRLMRDKGFNFYRQDIYCDNLFARNFDITDLPPQTKFELLTAFEVFEHLVNPVEEIKKMLQHSDSILFSTELQPTENVTPENWWYFIQETGQHLSLYSRKSLLALAEKLSLHLYTDNKGLHLLSAKKISPAVFSLLTKYKYSKLYNFAFKGNKSLQAQDFNMIRSAL